MTQINSSKTALITGASNGIGYELTQIFARNQYNLVLVARSADKLQQIAQSLIQQFDINVKVIPADLSLADAPDRIFKELQEESIKIDVLVNNAGFGLSGAFNRIDLAEQLQLLQVNIVALTHLSKLFLPAMIAQKSGKILNVGSTASFLTGPFMAVYYASKAYVLSFSEALASELEDTGVTVTALCPGPTQSGFSAKANLENSALFTGSNVMDAQTVAEIAYRGLMQNKRIIVPGGVNKFLVFLVRLLPRNVVTNIVKNLQKGN